MSTTSSPAPRAITFTVLAGMLLSITAVQSTAQQEHWQLVDDRVISAVTTNSIAGPIEHQGLMADDVLWDQGWQQGQSSPLPTVELVSDVAISGSRIEASSRVSANTSGEANGGDRNTVPVTPTPVESIRPVAPANTAENSTTPSATFGSASTEQSASGVNSAATNDCCRELAGLMESQSSLERQVGEMQTRLSELTREFESASREMERLSQQWQQSQVASARENAAESIDGSSQKSEAGLVKMMRDTVREELASNAAEQQKRHQEWDGKLTALEDEFNSLASRLAEQSEQIATGMGELESRLEQRITASEAQMSSVASGGINKAAGDTAKDKGGDSRWEQIKRRVRNLESKIDE